MSEKKEKNWQIATLLKSELTAVNVKAMTFQLAGWHEHKPGQHYDIRLTAPDGYVAERSYSIASPPEQAGEIEFGVQILENGEVSPFLWQIKPATASGPGDQVEIRGPIGGHFVWCHSMPGPLVLIGGGSGLVPLMSMIRHAELHRQDNEMNKSREIILLASFRTLEHVLYRNELENLEKTDQNFKFVKVLTDHEPRLDENKLRETVGALASQMPMCYICGPTKFVEVMAGLLVKMGINPHEIRTERFG